MTDSHQATPPQPPLPLLPQRPRPSTYATSSIAATWRASSLLGEHKLLYRSFILFKALLSRSFPSLSFFPSAFPFFFIFFYFPSFFTFCFVSLCSVFLVIHLSFLFDSPPLIVLATPLSFPLCALSILMPQCTTFRFRGRRSDMTSKRTKQVA
jgi:hypothetical protein